MSNFDVIVAGEFRFPGGTSAAVAQEVRLLSSIGLSVGLCQVNSDLFAEGTPWNQNIAELVTVGQAEWIGPGVGGRCNLLLAHNPRSFADRHRQPSGIEANSHILVMHHSPIDAMGRLCYDPQAVDRNLNTLFGGPFTWAPISPVSRRLAERYLRGIKLLSMDWNNVISVHDWGEARSHPLGAIPVIGRHSRPEPAKWPESRDRLLTIYPDAPDIRVRLLGIDSRVLSMVGRIPENWHTFAFGTLDVREFLRSIDFFVYYHHPRWSEAFGRTMIEAAGAGAVLILPEHFRDSFQEAALYRRPEDVIATVRRLHDDPELYRLHSHLGRTIIDRLYGPAAYIRRIKHLLAETSGRSVHATALARFPAGTISAPHLTVKRLAFHARRQAENIGRRFDAVARRKRTAADPSMQRHSRG